MFLIACTTRVAGFKNLDPRKVRCRLSFYPKCYLVSLPCPPQCPHSCLMDCTLCKPICQCNRPGAVCQDPRFVGGDGITFYFHGQKDKDFCLVTDSNLHINAHFIGKHNPTSTLKRRDFTWVQSLAILFHNHRLFIGAKKNITTLWDDTIDHLELSFNEHTINLPSNEGAVWESMSTDHPRVFITRTRVSNGVKLEVEGKVEIMALVVPVTQEESEVHKYNVGKDESLAHLDLGFKLYGMSEKVDGVLGRTYRKNYKSRAKMGVAMPVLGGDREFVSSDLFSTDCLVSQFNGTARSYRQWVNV
ncbi:hypothetical protein DsansV1_C19g0156131 [Dioscorea sansibarensis]